MTAKEIITAAVDLLGYRDTLGEDNVDSSSARNMLTYVNTALRDINGIEGSGTFEPIRQPNQEIKGISDKGIEAVTYGVCMWVAFNSGDGEKHAFFTHLYNAKRTALSQRSQIRNTIPSPEE